MDARLDARTTPCDPPPMDLNRTHLDRRIDRLIAPHAGPSPGVTVGVIRDGHLVTHRHAGLANVEHAVPIGPHTRFRIASVSKQFTCAAILMLADEGRLQLHDPVQAHIPELPAYPHPVTVAHLMHNTSGLRDMLELMRLGGADLGTPIVLQDLVDAICRQRTLNFRPGARFLYSNSNFLLLGLIAERRAAEPLATFLDRRIFTPLGMNATRLTPDVFAAIPHLATGYFPDGPGWRRAPHAFPLAGEGGLVSTIEDLALWDRHLGANPSLAAGLATQTPFNNGAENRYARGQAVRPYRDQVTVSHGGLWPGYRTEFLRVPAIGTTIIAIANTGSADPNLLAHQVLDVILDGRPGTPPAPLLPTPDQAAPFVGRWIDPATAATLDIATSPANETTLTANGLVTRPELDAHGRLSAPRANGHLALRSIGPDEIEVEQDAGVVGPWRRAPAAPTLPPGLAGAYRSAELAATWTLTGTEVRATGPVATGQPWDIEPIAPDLIRIHIPGTLYRAWLDVRVLRDPTGAVTGLEANGARVKAMRLDRQAATPAAASA